MFAAGMLASIAPVHAAGAAFGQAVFTTANPEGTAGTITYSHSFIGPVLFVTESSTHGAHNVTVPEDGASEPFGPDWGHITVKYLDPTTSTWKPAGQYTVPTSPGDTDPTPDPTETAPTPTPDPTDTTTPLPDDTDRKILICHATHPRAEAYEPIEVSITAILVGHGQHEGDIIPPIAYVKDGLAGGYPGNRWNEEGIAIYNNGCTVIPITTPSPTETTTPTETAQPSPSETTSPTASSSPTETATQVPTSAAPSTSQVVIPVKSNTAMATATVSRYPAALVDTAVKGGERQGGVSVLLFGGAAIAALIGLLLIRSGACEGRRH